MSIELMAGVLSLIADWLTAPWMPFELQVYRASEDGRAWTMADWAIAVAWIVLLVAALVSFVALWRLQPWGRTLYTYSTIGFFVLLAFGGPIVSHSVVYTLDAIGGAAAGMILGLLWFSTLSEMFDRRST
jgi:hypothetical protein